MGQLMVGLAGGVAEEILYQLKATGGRQVDLDKTTRYDRMVRQWGMDGALQCALSWQTTVSSSRLG